MRGRDRDGSAARKLEGVEGELGRAAPVEPSEGEGGAAFDGQYRIKLESFEGPLDLLLHLIQQHELDILDIPVSFITEKYLEYLKLMQVLSIEIASEYLVMAATLVHIKSKMLLPAPPAGQDDGMPQEEEEDPRAELVRRLLEYQKYKAAAAELSERGTLGRDVFARGVEEEQAPGPAPFAKMEVFGLLEAFERILKKTKVKIDHEVVFDRISITDRIVELTEKLEGRRAVRFEWLFLGARDAPVTRFDLVITFLAMLEMCRMKLLRVYQTGPLAPIYMGLIEEGGDLSDTDRAEADAEATPLLAPEPESSPPPPAAPPESSEEPAAESAEELGAEKVVEPGAEQAAPDGESHEEPSGEESGAEKVIEPEAEQAAPDAETHEEPSPGTPMADVSPADSGELESSSADTDVSAPGGESMAKEPSPPEADIESPSAEPAAPVPVIESSPAEEVSSVSEDLPMEEAAPPATDIESTSPDVEASSPAVDPSPMDVEVSSPDIESLPNVDDVPDVGRESSVAFAPLTGDAESPPADLESSRGAGEPSATPRFSAGGDSRESEGTGEEATGAPDEVSDDG